MRLCRFLMLWAAWQPSCTAGEPLREDAPNGSLHGAVVLHGDISGIDSLDGLIVAEKSRGVRNAFVYLPADSDLKLGEHESFDDVTVRIADAQFVPRACVARTGQTIRFENADDDVHHVRMTPLRTALPGLLVNLESAMQTFCFERAEPIPMSVRCDVDTRMRGWILVVDHPYATVTDENGAFKIDDIPAGEHKFRIWHERSGYLEKSLTVKIEANQESHLGKLKYSADKFKESP